MLIFYERRLNTMMNSVGEFMWKSRELNGDDQEEEEEDMIIF